MLQNKIHQTLNKQKTSMIKLIKKFLTTGIEANNVSIEANKMSIAVNKLHLEQKILTDVLLNKNINYLDELARRDNFKAECSKIDWRLHIDYLSKKDKTKIEESELQTLLAIDKLVEESR